MTEKSEVFTDWMTERITELELLRQREIEAERDEHYYKRHKDDYLMIVIPALFLPFVVLAIAAVINMLT